MFKYKLCNGVITMFILRNNDYRTYLERYKNVLIDITELKQEISMLKTSISSLQIENDDLRDKVLRKIQKPKDKQIELTSQAGQKYRG